MFGQHTSREPPTDRVLPFSRTLILLSTIAVATAFYLVIESGAHFQWMESPGTVPTAMQPADGIRLLSELLLLGLTLAVWTWLLRRSARHEMNELIERNHAELRAEVAERRRAERNVAEREALLRAILDNSPAAIAMKDPEGRYILVNRFYAERIGRTGEDVLGLSTRDIFPPDKADVISGRDRSVMASGSPLTIESIVTNRPDGPSYFQCVKFPVRDSDNALIGLGLIQTDVSEEKRIELALRDSEARFRAIFEHAPSGISLIDREGRYILVNPALCAMFARSSADMIGQRCVVFAPEAEREASEKRLRNLFHGDGSRQIVEKAVQRGDGSLIWVAVSSTPLRDANGEPWISVNLYEDITERRRMVGDMRLARDEAERASRAQTRFLAAASHDLRQPLQALGLFLSVLVSKTREGRPVNPGEIEHLLGRMRVSLDTLEGLFSALLDVSKLDAGVMRPEVCAFPLQRLLDRLDNEFRPLAMKKALDFRVVASSGTALSDPNMLDRILRNLVSNAIHCTTSGRVLLGVRRRAGMVSIQVLDTGPGIPADQMEAIFEEFHRLDGERREHGLGLGLAIVRRVAALLGHPIAVRSIPGKGSVFSVDVPLTDLPLAVSDVAVPVPSAPIPGRTILAIDDDDVVLDSLRMLLRTWGYRTLAAASFNQARDLIELAGEQPDLILADLRLSKGGDGMAAIQAIRRAAGRMIPGIILTGNTAPQCLRPQQRNALTILHKPVPPEKLGLALIQALSNRPAPFDERSVDSGEGRETILSRA